MKSVQDYLFIHWWKFMSSSSSPEIEKRKYSPEGSILKYLVFLLLDHSQTNCCSILNPPKIQPLIVTWWELNVVRTGLSTYPTDVATWVLHVLFQPQPPAHSLRAPLWSAGSSGASCCGLERVVDTKGVSSHLYSVLSNQFSGCDQPKACSHLYETQVGHQCTVWLWSLAMAVYHI